jgi:cell division initiation protein
MDDRPPPTSLNYSLDSLPRGLIRGYDRQATEQLFGRLNASYKAVVAERERLKTRVDELEAAAAQNDETGQQLTAEIETLKTELEHSQEREHALADRLERAKTYMDEEVARVRAEVENELERLKADVAAHEKRELLVSELLEAAKRTAETVREEARKEATLVLKKARKRHEQLLRQRERENKRLAEEKERLTETATKLRADLSTALISTLRQLEDTAADADRPEIPTGSERPAENRDTTGTATPLPAAKADAVVKRLTPKTRRQSSAEDKTDTAEDHPEADLTAS